MSRRYAQPWKMEPACNADKPTLLHWTDACVGSCNFVHVAVCVGGKTAEICQPTVIWK